MRRTVSCVLPCALVAAFATGSLADDEPQWATVKGRVVFPKGAAIPPRKPLNVTVNQQQCLAKGPILDESVIVNPKNRGVKNVVVYLRPDNMNLQAEFAKKEIHPGDAKRKPVEVVIDQPCCMFVERVTCARVGDTVVVKNPVAIAHNFFWDSADNGAYNVNVPANGQWKMPKALLKEGPPIQYKCTIHGWMTGYVRIFDHPYFAVTDADGNFEIKSAPVGKYRIVYWHENGVRGGAKGRAGEKVEIKGPVTALDPAEFDVTAK
jgi:hypothetical protein